MRKSRLATDAYQQMRFALSDASPIHVMTHTYADRAQDRLFDMHFELELGIVLRGRMRRHAARSQRTYAAGEAWSCGMWEPHGYEILEAPCEVVVLVIWPPLLANLFLAEAPNYAWMSPFTLPPGQRLHVPPARRGDVLAHGRRLAALAGDDTAAGRVRRRLFSMELLLQLLEDGAGASTPTPAPEIYHRLSPALDLVFRARTLVTTAVAADACAMSEDQFARHFQALMGLSFAQFALRHRIHGAAQEVASTDHPIKAIAHRWGFADDSHLHRLFLKHYGCSPAAYRGRR